MSNSTRAACIWFTATAISSRFTALLFSTPFFIAALSAQIHIGANSSTPVPYTYPSGVVGDFNHDGIPDMAVFELTDSLLVSIQLGLGNGAFRLGPQIPVTPNAALLIGADFNQDGVEDIAVVSSELGAYSVLLGNPDGTFQPEMVGTTPFGANTIAVGHLNGDKFPDLIVVGDTGVVALLGNGDGTFTAGPNPITLPANSYCEAVAVADFNADQIADIALGCRQSLQLYLGLGDGSFGSPATVLAGNFGALAAADFNGDGLPDLAAVNLNGSRETDILSNNGAGTLLPVSSYATGTAFETNYLAAADLNGDGILDLIGSNNATGFSVLPGSGGGAFQPLIPLNTSGQRYGSAVIADFDNDGRKDVVTVSQTALGFLKGIDQEKQIFEQPKYIAIQGAGTSVQSAGAAGDFNRDGLDDLVIYQSQPEGPQLTVATNIGHGSFVAGAPLLTLSSDVTIAQGITKVLDLNKDGIPDIVFASPTGTLYTAIANVDGSFGTAKAVAGIPAGVSSIVLADFTGDGKPDIALTFTKSLSEFYSTPSTLIYPGLGDGTFATPFVAVPFGPPVPLLHPITAVADLNADGKPDLVEFVNGTVFVYFNQGRGAMKLVNQFAAPSGLTIAAGNLVEGGFGAIVIASAAINVPGAVTVLPSNGDGTFAASVNYVTGNSPNYIGLADLTGDGVPEILTSNDESNDVSILENNGAGTFTYIGSWGASPNQPVVGHFLSPDTPAILEGLQILPVSISPTP